MLISSMIGLVNQRNTAFPARLRARPAGNTVAEVLGISLVTVFNALAMNVDPTLPPAVMPKMSELQWKGIVPSTYIEWCSAA
jgi:hypothetical protein